MTIKEKLWEASCIHEFLSKREREREKLLSDQIQFVFVISVVISFVLPPREHYAILFNLHPLLLPPSYFINDAFRPITLYNPFHPLSNISLKLTLQPLSTARTHHYTNHRRRLYTEIHHIRVVIPQPALH